MQSKEQLMWTKVTREKVFRVEVKLAAAAASLMGMQLGSGPRECATLMNEAAALLQGIYKEIQLRENRLSKIPLHGSLPSQREAARTGGGATDSPAMEPLTAAGNAEILRALWDIQVHVSELGRLNDAALGLCRGWLSVQPAPVEDYAPGGVWSIVREPDGCLPRA